MAVIDNVLDILENGQGEFFSGEAIAEKLDVSRNAVWKAINTLKQKGYRIESVTNKGYRLSTSNDILSENLIKKELAGRKDNFTLEIHDVVDSTNNNAKLLATEGAPAYTVVIANEQTKGRGRNNRVFYSPEDTGVYFSVVLRPRGGIMPSHITCMTAVAVARAIEDLTEHKPAIKWVNDIYVNGKKVCGILTEGAYSFEDERLQYAIVGIGINVTCPHKGFDKEIENIATYIADDATIKNRLVGRILSYMYDYIEHFDKQIILEEYRKRMTFIGHDVDVVLHNESYPAVVDSVDDDFGLVVIDGEKNKQTLTYGEISLRIKN